MIRRIAAIAALVLSSTSLYAKTYTLDPNHAEGIVRWSHLGFSNPTAQFTHAEGTLEFDPSEPTKSSVVVTVKIVNLTSGIPDLDDGLRSADFFDIAKYPTAIFKSVRVERGDAVNKLKVFGELTMHGITRPTMLDVTINKVGINPRIQLPAVGFEATTVLKRSDFGLAKYFPQVSDEVSLHITCQANEAKGYAALLKAAAGR